MEEVFKNEILALKNSLSSQIETMGNDLKNEIAMLREEVKMLGNEVKMLKETCSRMNNHITFVEGVYDTVRAPANFIKGKIDYMMGRNTLELPRIETSQPENTMDEIDW